jgi:hypothetical protein
MAERDDQELDVERDEFSLRGDFGPQGSWCKFGDRPDFTRDYQWRFRWHPGRSEPSGGTPDVAGHYSGGTQIWPGKR